MSSRPEGGAPGAGLTSRSVASRLFTVGVEGPLPCVDLPPAACAAFVHNAHPSPVANLGVSPGRQLRPGLGAGALHCLLVAPLVRFGRPGILLVNSRGFDQTFFVAVFYALAFYIFQG